MWVCFCSTSWSVFKREALKLIESLRVDFDDFDYETRKGKSGSFEVILADQDNGKFILFITNC